MDKIKNYTLENGVEIPCMGLGTASLTPQQMITSIEVAYNNGCTLIDTGNAYASESYIGNAIRTLRAKGVLNREDLFLSSKVGDKLNERSRPIGYYFYNSVSAPSHDIKKIVYEQVETSLKHLDTDYIDLMLIHWPYYEVLNEIWQYLEELYEQKVIRAIGVSNCKKRHIERIMRTANVKPMVNQFNISPINTCGEDFEYFKANNIVMEAYSPLYTLQSEPYKHNKKRLEDLAMAKGKTPSQLILRWYYQKGVVPIPKSSKPYRLTENYRIFDFELTESEMKIISGLNVNFNYLVESLFCPGY